MQKLRVNSTRDKVRSETPRKTVTLLTSYQTRFAPGSPILVTRSGCPPRYAFLAPSGNRHRQGDQRRALKRFFLQLYDEKEICTLPDDRKQGIQALKIRPGDRIRLRRDGREYRARVIVASENNQSLAV